MSKSKQSGTYNISKGTEAKLSNNSSGAGGQLDGSVGAGRHLSGLGIVNNSKHSGKERDGEDIVAIGEEAHASNQDSPHVVPAERSLVNLGQRKTSSLIGILDMDLRGSSAWPRYTWVDRRKEIHTKSLWKLWYAALPPVVLAAKF